MKHTHKLIFQRENIHRIYEKFMHFFLFLFSIEHTNELEAQL